MSHERRSPAPLSLVGALALLALGSTGADKGCARAQDSSDVAQDEIVAQHWVVFDDAADKTTARATFRFGNELGTVLQLQPPAQVTFHASSALPFDANWGWHHAELAGRIDGGTFTYRDVEGTLRKTTMPAFVATSLPAIATISRGTSSPLAWQGPPLGDGEEIEVYVASAANRVNIVRFATGAKGVTSIVLTPDVLAQLPPGGVVIALNRHRVSRPDGRTKVTTTWKAREATATLQ